MKREVLTRNELEKNDLKENVLGNNNLEKNHAERAHLNRRSRRNKILKLAAFVTALGLIVGIGFFANGLMGNPISKMLATRTAKAHLAEVYADTDFVIEDVRFDFKSTGYYAHVKSPSSMDSHFTLYLGMDGRMHRDTYKEHVTSGYNTAMRLDMDYRELADTVFESQAFPFESDIAYGELEWLFRDYDIHEGPPTYGLEREELVLDKLYDIRELGARAGHLVLYVQDETVSMERAAEILLELKAVMDEAGVPFYALHFVLECPKLEDGTRGDARVDLMDFLYADIYEEGMLERVKEVSEKTEAYYAELDREKGL